MLNILITEEQLASLIIMERSTDSNNKYRQE